MKSMASSWSRSSSKNVIGVPRLKGSGFVVERRSKLSIKLGLPQFSLWGGSPEVPMGLSGVSSCRSFCKYQALFSVFGLTWGRWFSFAVYLACC